MKRFLLSLIIVAILVSTFVIPPVSASVLCGETDYSNFPEWQGTAATPKGEWEMSPLGELGYTISHGSSYGTTNTKFSTAPGVLTISQVSTMNGATYRTSLDMPMCETIPDIFGSNADVYIHEVDVKFSGIERKITDGNSFEFYFGGAGWPGALQLKVFSDGFMNGKSGTSAKFEIDSEGDRMTLIAAVNFKTQRTNFYVKRGDELTLVLGNQGFAYNNTGSTQITALNSILIQVHGTMNAGAQMDIYSARIYRAAEAPFADFMAEQITGAVEPGEALTVNYEYNDELAEKGTEINWYTYTDEYGNGEKLVHISTYSKGDSDINKQYVLTDEDLTGGKYIKATVLPKSSAEFPDYKTGEMIETDLKSLYYEMGNFKFYREAATGKNEVTEDNAVLSTDKLSITYTSYYPESDLEFIWFADGDEIGTGKEVLLTDEMTGKTVTCKLKLKAGVEAIDKSEWIAIVPSPVDFDSKPEITERKYKNRNDEVIEEADNYTTLYADYLYNDDGITEGNTDDIRWYESATGEENSFSEIQGRTGLSFSPVEYPEKYIRYSVEAKPLKGSKNGDIVYSEPILISPAESVLMTDVAFDGETPDKVGNNSSVNIKAFVNITPANSDNLIYHFICGNPSDSGKAHFDEDGILYTEKEGEVTVSVRVVCDLDAVSFEKTITKKIEIAKLIETLGFSISNNMNLTFGNQRTVSNSDILINNKPASEFGRGVDYSWKSSDTSVVTVSNSGVITSVGVGTAKITLTAKFGGAEKSADITVTVTAVTIKPSGGNFGGSGGGGGGYKKSSSAGSMPALNNTTVATPVVSKFEDVQADAWYAESVNALSEKGILKGRSESRFFPEETVTRAEFSKIIAMAFELSADENYVPHKDVVSDEWYCSYISSVNAAGLMVGSDNLFRPNESLNKEEAVVVLNNLIKKGFAKAVDNGTPKVFGDSKIISDWAVSAVSAISSLGIINGNQNGLFEPQKACTRAEIAKMVYELIKINGGF